MRESIAILEVEREDYKEKLQRATEELKTCRAELKDLLKMKMQAQVEVEVNQPPQGAKQSLEAVKDSPEFAALQEKLLSTEKQLDTATVEIQEKQQLTSWLDESLEAEKRRSEDLKRELEEVLQLCATMEEKISKEETKQCVTAGVQTVFVHSLDNHTQTDEVVAVEFAHKEVQVDTLADDCTRYRLELEEEREHTRNLEGELSTTSCRMKEAESKIHQLLSIKEQLTRKTTASQETWQRRSLRSTR